MKRVRWSDLKWMRVSPAHYAYYLQHPIQESPAMRVGSFVHWLVLGGKRRFVCYDGVRRGKEWTRFHGDHIGETILNRKEWDTGTDIAESVRASKPAMTVLNDGVKEQRHEWEINGIQCHGTPDVLGGTGLTDLKVSRTSNPADIYWHGKRMGWLGQQMWYENGVAPGKLDRISIVAVEHKPPHVVTVFDFTEADREEGAATWRSAWERLMVCMKSGYYPGYVENIAQWDRPDPGTTIVLDGEEIDV